MKKTICAIWMILLIILGLVGLPVQAAGESGNDESTGIKYGSHIYTVVDIPEDMLNREGFTRGECIIRDVRLTAWFKEADPDKDFCQVYLQCGEDEPSFYQYDLKEDTLQRVYEPNYSRNLNMQLDKQAAGHSFDIWWLRIEIGFCGFLLLILLLTSIRISMGRKAEKPISSTRALFLAQEVEASYGDKELKSASFGDDYKMNSSAVNSLNKDDAADNIYIPVLTGIHYDNASITISWKPSEDVDGYNVYRKEVDGAWKLISGVRDKKASSFTDDKLQREELYTYTVRAYMLIDDEEMQGDYNRQGLTELALSGNLPAMPELKSAELAGEGVCIQWWKVPDADFYNIYRHTEGEGWNLLTRLQNTSITSYTDRDISPDTLYYYTVRSGHRTPEKNYLSEYQKPGLQIRTGS